MIEINVAKEFTETPGLRYKHLSDFSGELFRERFLLPQLKKAIELNEVLIVDLDDTYGYPPSFLEEAFGGLSEFFNWDHDKIIKHLHIISYDEPKLVNEIQDYIKIRCATHNEENS